MSILRIYDKVRVISELPLHLPIHGAQGAVLGISDSVSGERSYAVFIYSTERVWQLSARDIAATGEEESQSTFYDGTVIHVQVDPYTGKGTTQQAQDEQTATE